MCEKITYHYLTDEEPMSVNVVFLGVDLGSNDITAYFRYDGKVFRPITKEEYEKYNS